MYLLAGIDPRLLDIRGTAAYTIPVPNNFASVQPAFDPSAHAAGFAPGNFHKSNYDHNTPLSSTAMATSPGDGFNSNVSGPSIIGNPVLGHSQANEFQATPTSIGTLQGTSQANEGGQQFKCQHPNCDYMPRGKAKNPMGNLLEHVKYNHFGNKCMFPTEFTPGEVCGIVENDEKKLREHIRKNRQVIQFFDANAKRFRWSCPWPTCGKTAKFTKESAERCLFYHQYDMFHGNPQPQRTTPQVSPASAGLPSNSTSSNAVGASILPGSDVANQPHLPTNFDLARQ
ncbi:hypothetical protein F5Y02DRAFT_426989 [Annulohypoxylon stygium]|nr:hypothetical protein F5Y02DRAFT_426989 [Annulohypoxylon stygium]